MATEESDRYVRLMTILNERHFFAKELANLVDLSDYDNLAKALVFVSHEGGVSLPLIRSVVAGEFEKNIRNPANILRGNSVASKMMGAYCRKVGQEWLHRYLGDSIRGIVQNEGMSMEVDPNRVAAPAQLAENEQLLRDFTLKMFNDLTVREHARDMPRGIRALAGFVAEYARTYAADRLLPLVGGFLFLRFFNPSIVTPEAYGLLPEGSVPSRTVRRNLTLITKVLQNLSNDVLFGAKEQYMMCMNSFIEDHCEVMRTFLNEVIQDPRVVETGEESQPWRDCREPIRHPIDPSKVDLSQVRFLHRVLFLFRGPLLERLHELATATVGDADYSLEEELFRLLDQMGPPAEDLRSLQRPTLSDATNVSFLVAPIRSGHVTVPKKIKPRKRYWVVLTEHFLYYFSSSDDTIPHKSVSMDDVFLPDPGSAAAGSQSPQTTPAAKAASGSSGGEDVRRTMKPLFKEEFAFPLSVQGKLKSHLCQSAEEVRDWTAALRGVKERRAKARPSHQLGELELRMRNYLTGRNVHYECEVQRPTRSPLPDGGFEYSLRVRAFSTEWILSKSYRDVLYLHHRLLKSFPKRIFPSYPKSDPANSSYSLNSTTTPPPGGGEAGGGVTPLSNDVVGGSGGHPSEAASFYRFLRSYFAEVGGNLHVSQHSDVLEFLEVSSVQRALQSENLEQLEYLLTTGTVGLDVPTVIQSFHREGSSPTTAVESPHTTSSSGVVETTPLHLCVQLGCERPCRYILSRMHSVDVADGRGETPLMQAVRLHRSAFVAMLADAGADLAQTDALGRTVVHVAVEEGLADVVAYAVEQGRAPLLDARDRRGRSALHVAVQCNRPDLVQYFLGRGAATDPALLAEAVERNAVDIAELLLQRGSFDVAVALNETDGQSALHRAAHGGHVRLVDLMLRQKSADLRARDKRGRTVLMAAAEAGHVDVARRLVAAASAALIDAQTPLEGHCALHLAVHSGAAAQPLTALLLAAGARVDLRDAKGRTPLHEAAERALPEVLQLLLHHGARVDVADLEGRTPLHVASLHAHASIVHLLILSIPQSSKEEESGTNSSNSLIKSSMNTTPVVDRVDLEGHTALHLAVWAQKEDVVEELLAGGASVHVVDAQARETVLHVAAAYSPGRVVARLLRAGAKIYATQAAGNIPLHRAAQEGNVEAVEALLHGGTALNAQNRHGNTPLHDAVLAGHDHIALLLVRAGADPNALNKELHPALHGCRPKLRAALADAAALGPPDYDALARSGRSNALRTARDLFVDPTENFPCVRRSEPDLSRLVRLKDPQDWNSFCAAIAAAFDLPVLPLDTVMDYLDCFSGAFVPLLPVSFDFHEIQAYAKSIRIHI